METGTTNWNSCLIMSPSHLINGHRPYVFDFACLSTPTPSPPRHMSDTHSRGAFDTVAKARSTCDLLLSALSSQEERRVCQCLLRSDSSISPSRHNLRQNFSSFCCDTQLNTRILLHILHLSLSSSSSLTRNSMDFLCASAS